jgi:hypothetical protein
MRKRTLLTIATFAPALSDCDDSVSVVPRSRAMQRANEHYPVQVPTAVTAVAGPPDVAAAEADEAAALERVLSLLPAEMRSQVSTTLRRPGHIISGTANQQFSELIGHYYAARNRARLERRRAMSIAQARQRGRVQVVVIRGTPPDGSAGLVLRRRLADPQNVIILGQSATAEALGGALAALDISRSRHGDDLAADETIGFRDVQAKAVPPSEMARLQRLVARLSHAPARLVDGFGTVPAIEIASYRMKDQKR